MTGNRQEETQTRCSLSARRSLQTAIALGLMLLLATPASFADKNKDLRKHFGLIFGTAYDPNDRPVYGAKIEIHPVEKKHPSWELVSDHRGEFAQRVPPGPTDYLISGEVELAPIENGVPQTNKKKKMKAETKVHIEGEERQDVSLHFHD